MLFKKPVSLNRRFNSSDTSNIYRLSETFEKLCYPGGICNPSKPIRILSIIGANSIPTILPQIIFGNYCCDEIIKFKSKA